MKEDAKKLFTAVRDTIGSPYEPYQTPRTNKTIREIISELNIPEKRAEYLLEKWADKEWYEYGVNCFNGWMLPKGMELDINSV